MSDFMPLTSGYNFTILPDIWGLDGYAGATSLVYYGEQAYYWSSTEYPSNTNNAYHLNFGSNRLAVSSSLGKYYGMQVRCVK
jgi:uncharacterized protein (TIGR02145 family)